MRQRWRGAAYHHHGDACSAYAEVFITSDDSRRPTNRTPWTGMAGGGHVARVALVALYPGCRRPQGHRLHVFPGRLRPVGLSRCVALYPGHRGQRRLPLHVLLRFPAAADHSGSGFTCCSTSIAPLATARTCRDLILPRRRTGFLNLRGRTGILGERGDY